MFTDRDGKPCDFEAGAWDGTLFSYFRDQPNALVAHQIDSYNHALESMIPQIIHDKENNPIRILGDFSAETTGTNQHNMEYELHFKQVSIGRPVLQVRFRSISSTL